MPPPTRVQKLRTKWRRMPLWGKVTTITTVIVGLTGSVTGLKAAWPMLRLALPALVFYVDSTVDAASFDLKTQQSTTIEVLRDLQIETAEGKRDAAATAIDKFTLDLNRAKDDDEKIKINQAIREQRNTMSKLNSQIDTLNKLKAQGH